LNKWFENIKSFYLHSSLNCSATGIPFDIRYVAFGDQDLEAGFSLVATQVPCGAMAVGASAAD